MESTLVNLLQNTVERFPEKTAIVYRDREVPYRALWNKACGVARYFVGHGLQSGDRVALLIENSAEYVIAYYAVLMAGGAVVALNTDARSRDLVNWIRHSESSFLVAQSKQPELKSVIETLNGAKVRILLADEYAQDHDYPQMMLMTERDEPPLSAMDFDTRNQLASLIYTSGTTGRPKGVMLSHCNLYSNMQSILSYLELSETDSIVNVLPFYYSYGNSVLHIHLAAGATLYLENSMLYPQKILSLMAEKKVTGFSGVPSAFNLILSRTKLSDFDLSALRYMTQAGGPMAPAAIERVKKELPGIRFYVMYGQTEASARLSYLPADMLESKAGSIGVAIPGVELTVMDENHRPVPARVTGEIYARGDNIMLGYWKDADATRQVFYNDWLKTGDLAYHDEDGFLYIVGRSSEMIKSGAHRISPKDIEEVILELEGVEEVAVVGVEDDLLGQVIKAVIVQSPGAELDRKKVMHHCKSNLAIYKLPKKVEFADEIPRTASGKVRRFMLQEKNGE